MTILDNSADKVCRCGHIQNAHDRYGCTAYNGDAICQCIQYKEGGAALVDSETGLSYSEPQLNMLINSATKLGFWDDVLHYKQLLTKLQSRRNNNGNAARDHPTS